MDKFNRQKIRAILQDERFFAVEMLKKIVIDEIKSTDIKAETEFETLWRTAGRESKVEVLNDFFNRMIMEASKSDD